MATEKDRIEFATRFNRHFKRDTGPSVIFAFIPNQEKVWVDDRYFRYRLIIKPLPPFRFDIPTPSYISEKTIDRMVRDGFGQLGFEIKKERSQGLIWKSLGSPKLRRLYIAHLVDKSANKEWIKLGYASNRNPQDRFLYETTSLKVKIESIRTLDFWDAPTKNCIIDIESTVRLLSLKRLRELYPLEDFLFASPCDEYPLQKGGNSECMEIPSSLNFQTIRDVIWGVYDEFYSHPLISSQKDPGIVDVDPSDGSEGDELAIVSNLQRFLGGVSNSCYLTPWQFLAKYPPIGCKKLSQVRPTTINRPGAFKKLFTSCQGGVSFYIATPKKGKVTCHIDGSFVVLNVSYINEPSTSPMTTYKILVA